MWLVCRAASPTCPSTQLSLSGLSLALPACAGGGHTKGDLRDGMKAAGDMGTGERHSETPCGRVLSCHAALYPGPTALGALGVSPDPARPSSQTQPLRSPVPFGVPHPLRCLWWLPASQGQLPDGAHTEGVPSQAGGVGGAGVIIIFVFFALPWKYIVFSANPVQLHHNKTHNKNVIHFSRALHLPVSWQAIKNLSSFFWQEPCTFSSLIYESRIATDKPLLRGEGLHYL